MQCPKCGHNLPENIVFCGKCGADLSKTKKKQKKGCRTFLINVVLMFALGIVIGVLANHAESSFVLGNNTQKEFQASDYFAEKFQTLKDIFAKKSQEDIQLFLSDFPQHVRKGLLRSRQFKKELEELVPVGSSFIFSEDEMNVSKAAGLNFYERISQKAEQLQGLGLEQEEVDSILSTEVERTFAKYKVNLVGEVADKSQLAVLVDEILMDLVEEFLKNAEQTLDRKFPSSVFYGLCLHIKDVIEHTQEQHLLDKSRIAEILSKHQKEYLLQLPDN